MYHFVQLQHTFEGKVEQWWLLTDENPESLPDKGEKILNVIQWDLDKIQLENPEKCLDALEAINRLAEFDQVFTLLAGVFHQGYEAGQKRL